MPEKYRAKPVEIEAVRYYEEVEIPAYEGVTVAVPIPTQRERVARLIIRWVHAANGITPRFHCDSPEACAKDEHVLLIDTLEGTMTANWGDYIIKGTAGEFYPCKPDIFEAKYVKVEEHVPPTYLEN